MSAPLHKAIAQTIFKRIARKKRKALPRLSQQHCDELHAHELDTLLRNRKRSVATVQEFLNRIDGIVLCVAELRERYSQDKKSDWWHMADLLDDVADLRSALQGTHHHGVMQGSPVCKLVCLVEPSTSELTKTIPRAALAQAMCFISEEDVAQERVHARLRLEVLQNVPILAAPNIASATQFKTRLEGVVLMVAHLCQFYKTEQRSDWWHMADLLDDLMDLLDAVRSNSHNNTMAMLDVVDFPCC